MEIIGFSLPLESVLCIILCLLILSGFFSGSEIALFSFRKTRLSMLVKQGHKRAELVHKTMQKPETFLSTILVGNNLANTIASVLATAVALRFFKEHGLIIAMLVMSFFLIQFSEIIPKMLGSQYWEKISFAVVRPIRIFMVLFYPLVVFFSYLTNLLHYLFGMKIKYRKPFITKDELRHTVDLTKEAGYLKADETLILHNIFKFTDRLAREVMLLRDKVTALDITTSENDILKIITDTHHTRIPVYEGKFDNMVGVLYTKECLNVLYHRGIIALQDLLRPPYFVQEDKKISELLRDLRKNRVHLAIVKDKQNRVAGIITIEDILEEIVGEIMDEHDIETTESS